MQVPDNLLYVSSHEWVEIQADGTVKIGITEHAQDALGDIVFLDLPTLGKIVVRQEQCCVIESVKAASDIYAPISGEIIAVNEELASTPHQINENAYTNWIFAIKPSNPQELDALLNAEQYLAILGA